MKKHQKWNSLAHEYSHIEAITDWRLGYSVVEDLLGEVSGKQILDYGCGPGKFTRRLRDLGALVIAVDTSGSAISRARQDDCRDIDYRVIEDDDISFLEDSSIDYAVATFVLCTMQEESQIQDIVDQIYCKLKQGGSFVLLEPHPDSLGHEYVTMKKEKPAVVRSGMPIKTWLKGMRTAFYDYWRSIDDYVNILEQARFKVRVRREPIIENCPDETFWKDERIQPPLLIMCSKKE